MDISVQDLHAMRTDNRPHMLLDIREPQEVAAGAIAGSVHIPMNTIPNNLDKLPKDKPLVVMCHVGGRSAQVTHWLRAQGYDIQTSAIAKTDSSIRRRHHVHR